MKTDEDAAAHDFSSDEAYVEMALDYAEGLEALLALPRSAEKHRLVFFSRVSINMSLIPPRRDILTPAQIALLETARARLRTYRQ